MSENIIIALIGIGGAVVGSVATVAVKWFEHRWRREADRKKDEPRKAILMKMLENPDYVWRKLDTLSHTIGADEETTKRLLIEIGARSSEDEKPLWALLSRAPLPSKQ